MESHGEPETEKPESSRSSVLADLKSKSGNIIPMRHTDCREEVL